MRLRFKDREFDSDTRELMLDGVVVPVSPKAFALLELLILNRPNAVSREAIREHLWPDVFVSEASLGNLILELRTALRDPARETQIIRTVPRYGYAFCAAAESVETSRSRAESPPMGTAYWLVRGRREIPLRWGENLIGRDPVAVVRIDDEAVSRRHARIVIGEEGAVLEDLGSKNGTYLEGRRIHEASALADKDRLRVGQAPMTLRVLDRTSSTASTVKRRGTK